MSNCTEKIKTDECTETRDEGYQECDDWAVNAYTTCTSWKKKCKWYTFWNCIISWLCTAVVWVIDKVCKGYRWIENIVCVAWKYITKIICVIVDVITTIIGVIALIIDVILGIVGGILGIIWGFILAIPILGGIIGAIFNVIKTIVYAVLSIPDALLTLVGIMPEKKLRLLVIIQKDSNDVPIVATTDLTIVRKYIEYAINVFREEMNVRIVQVQFFTYKSAFEDDNTPIDKYIDTQDFFSTDASLDVCCDVCAFGHDLVAQGSIFNIKMAIRGFLTSGRRFIGYGAPIIAFAVRSFSDGKAGCSLGPLTDYVTVKFNLKIDTYATLKADQSLDAITDLAHEIGHCCYLPHKEDVNNLMNPRTNRTGKLTVWQKTLFRSSRHVTYF